MPDYGLPLEGLGGLKERFIHCQFQGDIEESNPSRPQHGRRSIPEDSEPLFVLEPLPELGGVIDTFASANPLFLIVSMAAALYLLTTFDDPLKKLWTTSLGSVGFNYYVTDSMYFTMIFTSIYVLVSFWYGALYAGKTSRLC